MAKPWKPCIHKRQITDTAATAKKPRCDTCPFALQKSTSCLAIYAFLQGERACIKKALKVNGLHGHKKPRLYITGTAIHDMPQRHGGQSHKTHGLTKTSVKTRKSDHMYTYLLHLTTISSFFTPAAFCYTFGFHYLCNRIKKTNYKHPIQQP